MSALHTPGTWSVEDGSPTSIWAGGRYVAETFADGEANARLIAAAPDLLIQLKGLLGFAQFVIHATDIDTELTTVVIRANGEPVAEVPIALILKHSEAAIAKAEGRS